MSNRARMPLHVGDYLADTGHVTATEHGAYLLLIMHHWQNGCLPENERIIARIAKLSPEQWEESRDMLAMLFGPGWTHKRIDAELSKADEIIEKRRSALRSEDASAPETNPDCEEFWEAYPNKIGRPSAEKAFSQAIKRASLHEIMTGVRATS
jgi:uncharacterized protein YdaU (DUF1376 family)